MYKIYSPPSPNQNKGYFGLNPYGSLDPTSQLSSWNRFTDWLGITNNAGKAIYNNQLMANQWETSRNLALEDREYNSFANQAQEMREAGLNPDFATPSAGMSDIAGQQPNNNVQPFTEEMAFGQFLSTAFNTAISVASGLANIQNLGFGQDLSILDSSISSAKKGLVGNASDLILQGRDLNPSDDQVIEFINRSDFTDVIFSLLSDRDGYKTLHNNFRTKRGKKIFDRFLDDYLMSDDVKNDILDAITKRYDKTLSSSAKVAEYDVMRSQDPNNELTSVSKVLAEYQYKYINYTLLKDSKKAQDDFSFQSIFDPTMAANAVNASNKEAYEARTADTNFKSLERGMINDLKALADDGNKIATALLGAIVIASKFSVTSSSGTHMNMSTGEVFSDSSRGLSFGF